jgi:hypothetical protein
LIRKHSNIYSPSRISGREILRISFCNTEARFRGAKKDICRVRVLAVDRMPLPEEPALAEASRRTQIITDSCRAIAIGHAVVLRADAWGDRELFLHQLVHVAQCERSGGLEQWVRHYLVDRTNCPNFTIGALEEEEARRIAREICAAEATA